MGEIKEVETSEEEKIETSEEVKIETPEEEKIETSEKNKPDPKPLFNTRGKRGAGYLALIFVLFYIFAILFNGTMEYYMTNTTQKFSIYVYSNYLLIYFFELPQDILSLPDVVTPSFYHAYAIILFLLLLFFVFFIFQRGYIAILTSGVLGMILCYASKTKFQYRKELLNIKDLALTEAAGMAKNYLKFDFGFRFFALFLIVLLFATAAFFADRIVLKDRKALTTKEKKIFWGVRIGLGLVVVVLMFHFQSRVDQHIILGDSTNRMVLLTDNPTDYFVYHFFEDKKKVYNADDVRTKYQELTERLIQEYEENDKYTPISPEDYPNVIVIMNESWWHMDEIDTDKMWLSQDPLGPVKGLGEQSALGSAAVGIYGGGTVSSEMEFLTGWNLKYAQNSTSISIETSKVKIHSIVDYFNSLDYETRAIHPYYSGFYSRYKVYNNLGFSHMTFEPDMKYKSTFDRYISDEALVDQIIYEFENKTKDKTFIFGVSVANHGILLEYSEPLNKDYPYVVDMKEGVNWAPTKAWSDSELFSLRHYVNGTYEASAAFAKLVKYFEEQDEPVILVMYGDHCPDFPAWRFYDLGALNKEIDEDWYPTMLHPGSSADTIHDTQTLYSVPVVSWSNCLDDADMGMDLSNISVLGSRIIKKSKLPMTKMVLLEDYFEKCLATDSLFYMMDVEHKIIDRTTKEIDDSIYIKSMLQYDQVFGDDVSNDVWVPMKD